MTLTTVAADIHQTLDVIADFSPERTLDLVFIFDQVTDLNGLFFGQVFHSPAGIDINLVQYFFRRCTAYPIDVREADDNTLVVWNIYSCNSRQR